MHCVGDLNSRFGRLDDTYNGAVQLNERKIIDEQIKANGSHFITYLTDAGECIVSGSHSTPRQMDKRFNAKYGRIFSN